ncbi:MAG: sigma-70 family RNA polymerase sigma factor [Planctomycetes bacterium]|nr:sigma-70 family RNA polymerase sigma factor [Planctomycetota bacterium]
MVERARALVERAQGGDRQAFDELVELYRSRLEARVQCRLGARLRHLAEVQDVVQETFARAFATLDRFQWREGDAFLAWLYGIAENVIRSLAQKGRRAGSFGLLDDPPGTDVTASRALRREERFARLEDSLRSLSEDHRQVILLARIERLTIKEIAERMGRSPDAVKQLLSRALAKLRAAFGHTESMRLPADRRLGDDGDGG